MLPRPVLLTAGALVVLGSASLLYSSRVADNADDQVISGVVTGPSGPEAGVWVIAETDDLPTKFRKIVVTDDQGRFLLPELPAASYRVWARGYGLVDSDPVTARPGEEVALTGVVARTPQEAAAIYPASSWLSLLEPPASSEFPGTGPEGNGISADIETLDEFMFNVKACLRCHQVGTKWTREIPADDEHASTIAAWDHRVQMGQRGGEMSNFMSALGRQRALQMFADWSERIAAGEVPAAPPRPQGAERNVVLTLWEWTDEMGKVHDEVATDKRDPRINANGPVYGTDIANDNLAILDPVTHTTKLLPIPTLVDRTTMPASYASDYPVPSRLAKLDRFNPTSMHNPMIDAQGRVWYTATLRPAANQPTWCTTASENKYAAYYPARRAGRNLSFYDPRTQQFTMVDTCFGGHHLQFGFDADQSVYISQPGGDVFGWVNTRQFDLTSDAGRSQGWCPTVVDSNGDGKITKPWNEPTPRGEEGSGYARLDPALDTRVVVGAYGLIVDPVDGSVWGANEGYPGKLVRLEVGDNPPESCESEVFEIPSVLWEAAPNGETGFKPRGLDVDRNGVIWTALAGTNHLASFDRKKCEDVNELKAHDGRQCAEGWTLHPLPAPTFKGTSYRADFYYYNWVDQFNTLGLGENIPIATGSGSNSLIALLPATGETVTMTVPYPLGGFHPRGLDGRIDDPDAGWKGRGVWSSTGSDGVWHAEGGLAVENGQYRSVSKPILVKFQLRPDPLAR